MSFAVACTIQVKCQKAYGKFAMGRKRTPPPELSFFTAPSASISPQAGGSFPQFDKLIDCFKDIDHEVLDCGRLGIVHEIIYQADDVIRS